MELGVSCENIRQLIVGKEAAEEKTEKAIIDLEHKCTFLYLGSLALIGACSVYSCWCIAEY